MEAHYVAMLTLLSAFAIKWAIKLILLWLHKEERIGRTLTIVLTVLGFTIAYTTLHSEPPSAEAVILLGIFVLHLAREQDYKAEQKE